MDEWMDKTATICPHPPLGSITTQLTQNIFVQAYVANIYERDSTRYTNIGIVKQ